MKKGQTVKCHNCGDSRPSVRKQTLSICPGCGQRRTRNLEDISINTYNERYAIQGHRYVFEEQPSELI